MIMFNLKVAAACGINGDVFTQVILMAEEGFFFYVITFKKKSLHLKKGEKNGM